MLQTLSRERVTRRRHGANPSQRTTPESLRRHREAQRRFRRKLGSVKEMLVDVERMRGMLGDRSVPAMGPMPEREVLSNAVRGKERHRLARRGYDTWRRALWAWLNVERAALAAALEESREPTPVLGEAELEAVFDDDAD